MVLHFTKMHGLGNDFVVIDLVSQNFCVQTKHILKLADRHHGIGCDQVLLVEPPRTPDADFSYRIFNADGGEVAQCGNGARCFAKFVYDQKLTRKRKIKVETNAGLIELNLLERGDCHIGEDATVEVDMGVPLLEPAHIPFRAEKCAPHYQLEVGSDLLEIGAVSMGNPHAVTLVESVAVAGVEQIGPAIENHPRFPERCNAGFMELISSSEIRLRVYERGVGETRACGTGACAAVVYGRIRGWLDETAITVHLSGGDLQISWHGPAQPVIMAGPAATVFEGQIRL